MASAGTATLRFISHLRYGIHLGRIAIIRVRARMSHLTTLNGRFRPGLNQAAITHPPSSIWICCRGYSACGFELYVAGEPPSLLLGEELLHTLG